MYSPVLISLIWRDLCSLAVKEPNLGTTTVLPFAMSSATNSNTLSTILFAFLNETSFSSAAVCMCSSNNLLIIIAAFLLHLSVISVAIGRKNWANRNTLLSVPPYLKHFLKVFGLISYNILSSSERFLLSFVSNSFRLLFICGVIKNALFISQLINPI